MCSSTNTTFNPNPYNIGCMKSIKSRVDLAIKRGNIHSNTGCEYHPCHYKGQNCAVCYCPFYPCNDTDLGRSIESKRGNGDEIWDCSQCLFNHRNDVVEYSFKRFSELGIESGDDPRIRDVVFKECKEKFFRLGKALMILGATSDAGKSLTVAAICRILARKGYVVTPFKSQNMSLNSRVTRAGHEISMIQDLQCKAAYLKNPTSNVNPILLKPKGDCMSQVIVEGKPFGDYDVEGYYNDFVPGPGKEIVKRNIDFLKKRYDYIIMEGAGSPAEINIYDKDIANMRAAEIADADCILVVNVEWGGSFAYAAGTIELMPEEDRKRIKGIILNNMRGKTGGMKPGIEMLEKITGVPVVGIIPHLDIELPKEDSEYFRNVDVQGSGTWNVAVIKLPRIANFTDIDPLALEDVTIKYVTAPEGLDDADAIIIPGTKNTMADLAWLKETGLYDAIKKRAGVVPILGICGGYQMMGRKLFDPNAIEDKDFPEADGLGLFDMTAKWDVYDKIVRQDHGAMNVGDRGEVDGYEIHMGQTVTNNEKPLFTLNFLKGDENEGSVREPLKLYGTYLHGVFERPAFRRYFISMMNKGTRAETSKPSKDYMDSENLNLDKLADGFEKGMDMDAFFKILEATR